MERNPGIKIPVKITRDPGTEPLVDTITENLIAITDKSITKSHNAITDKRYPLRKISAITDISIKH